MAKDLGLVSGPISQLFKQPANPEEWRSYLLSEEQLLSFKKYGYVKAIRVLNDEQIDILRSDLHDVCDPDYPGNGYFYEYHSNESVNPDTVLFHALGAWRVTPAFHDILWAPAFRMAAYQLLGKGYRLFHDQLFSKPAQHGGVVSWHQDFSYWTWTSPMAHLTCWIALDDVTTENGCMYYIPKSHNWGLLKKTGLAGDMDAIRTCLDAQQIECFEQKIPVELRKGEAAFHHPLMMHGSYENRSNSPRRATLINVFADGVVSNMEHTESDAAPGTDNYPKVPKGERMAGTYYPLLFDPESELGSRGDVVTVASLQA